MNTKDPLVSISLSTYNIEEYISCSLECIINQTLRGIEIICIDDASSDNTLNIINKFAKIDERIRVISKTHNEGLAVSRNDALKLAKGKYVIFLDGDDLFDLTMLEKAYFLAESEQSDMVLWDYAIFYNNRDLYYNKSVKSTLKKDICYDKTTLLRRPAFTWIKLIKTSVIRSLGINFPKGLTRQDIPVHWNLITKIDKVSILPERLSYYRQQSYATTSRTDKSLFDLATVMDITREYLINNKLYENYKDLFLESQLNLLSGMYDKIDDSLKSEARGIIDARLLEEQIQYINSGQPLRWQTRLFFLSYKGDKIAKYKLLLWESIRKFYRAIKN